MVCRHQWAQKAKFNWKKQIEALQIILQYSYYLNKIHFRINCITFTQIKDVFVLYFILELIRLTKDVPK